MDCSCTDTKSASLNLEIVYLDQMKYLVDISEVKIAIADEIADEIATQFVMFVIMMNLQGIACLRSKKSSLILLRLTFPSSAGELSSPTPTI